MLVDTSKRLETVERKKIIVKDDQKYNAAITEITKRIGKLPEKASQKGKGLASTIKGLLGPKGIPDPHKIKNLLEKKIPGKGTAKGKSNDSRSDAQETRDCLGTGKGWQ